jgi:bleomycin hydrolase
MRVRFIAIITFVLIVNSIFAGHKDDSKKSAANNFSPLEMTVEIPATEVKNQSQTSTCWCFSTLSMLESDILRTQKTSYNLSEMYIVRKVYLEKADRYIRTHGNISFTGGGEANDVIDAIKNYGIVPEELYSGLKSDSMKHDHAQLDYELKVFVQNIVENPEKYYSENWQTKFNEILDKYLGKVPDSFNYKGVEYTPQSFADSLYLNLDNYILITSFTHQPFYKPFILELPDNWSWGEVYNVSLDDLENIVHFVLSKGSSVVWATDYSENGFAYGEGLAVAPKVFYETVKKNNPQADNMSESKRRRLYFDVSNPVEELNVTQENRQLAFNNYSTTDDHGMHIVGEAKGIDNHDYFYVKNSWGTNNKYSGYLFASMPYFRYKTVSIMVDKSFLPDDIRKALNL